MKNNIRYGSLVVSQKVKGKESHPRLRRGWEHFCLQKFRSWIIVFAFVVSVIIVSYILTEGHQNSKWWRVYFTTPGFNSTKGINNPESELIALIGYTKKSFHGAFYDISSHRIADAVIQAHKRGVDVKLVTEGDNADRHALRKILNAGITVVADNRRGLMHNKFAIIDNNILWTGSYNLTKNGSMKNNNNAIVIGSKELATIYKNEFFEMFEYGIFGNRSEPGPFARFINKYYIKINNTNINVYFSPENNIERVIKKRIRKAKTSIHFMLFSFTSDVIGEEIIKSHKRGVEVYGILERYGANSRYSEYIKMKLEGIPVKLDRNRNMMHHKVLIIDRKLLITGSYNFSKGANKVNDENILIIDNEDITRKYLEEFYRLYK